jgi:hypothetical protein
MDPAIAALPAVATDPAIPALPAVRSDPATAALPAVHLEAATATEFLEAIRPSHPIAAQGATTPGGKQQNPCQTG